MYQARWLKRSLAGVFALALVAFGGGRALVAADHFDPPARTGSDTNTVGFDVAADIADVHAFHDAQNVYIALGFGGPSATNPPGFPIGRRYLDPVIDITLAVIFLDLRRHPATVFANLPVNPNGVDQPADGRSSRPYPAQLACHALFNGRAATFL